MKKIVLGLTVLIAGVYFSGCLKSNNNPGCPYQEVTSAKRVDTLRDEVKEYLNSKGITNVIEDSSGLFYTIHAAGTGSDSASACSVMTVTYKGKLKNDAIFDQSSDPVNFYLGTVITGWQLGLRKIKAGGKMTLYIPSNLGYGATPKKDTQGNTVIPANSMLIFDVDLVNLQ